MSEKKLAILKKHYREYFKDSFPAERLDNVVDQVMCIKEETEAIMNAMEDYAATRKPGAVWVKASERLPLHRAFWNMPGEHNNNECYFPIRIDGNKYRVGEIFDERKEGSSDPVYMFVINGEDFYERDFNRIEWLDENESPAEQPVREVDDWVSVDERLPELTEPLTWWDDETNQRDVIIPNHHAIVIAYNPELGVYKAKLEGKMWSEISSRSTVSTKETIPTHWKPLPGSPFKPGAGEKEGTNG